MNADCKNEDCVSCGRHSSTSPCDGCKKPLCMFCAKYGDYPRGDPMGMAAGEMMGLPIVYT